MKFNRLFFGATAASFLLLAGCQPISPDLAEPVAAPMAEVTAAPVEEAAPAVSPDAAATATITVRSGRVRQEASVNSPMIGGVKEGEVYEVVGRSSDGLWVQIRIPELGDGWINTDLVTVEGAITDLPIFEAPVVVLPTAVPVAETAPVTETAPVAEVTAEPTAEPVAEPTAVPTEEPVAEPTAEPVAEPTAEPVAEATAEPVAEPTAEPVAEATAEPVAEATAEPVAEATAAPVEEPAAPPAAGFARVISELRLRVRVEPSLEAERVGYAYPGEEFQVLETSADGQWTRIAGSAEAQDNANGGWVASEYLLLGQ